MPSSVRGTPPQRAGPAGEIQELCGARLQIGEPYTSHESCLLSLSRDVRGASYQKESEINSNTGANTLLIWTHGAKVGPYMNGLHFCFGLGACGAPLLVAQVIGGAGGYRWAYWTLAAVMTLVSLYLLLVSDHYPHRFSKRRATRQPSTSNVKSRSPRHKVRTPGIPSLRRFRCPPRRPIHKTACPSVSRNTACPLPNFATKTAHSSALSNTVAGASGSCSARSRNATMRAATLVYITIAFSKLSHFSSRRASIRQPLFSVK